MKATTQVRYLIEVQVDPLATPFLFDFASRDIGETQGTTIGYHGTVIARYRPGTRYWDRALEIAADVLREAFDQIGVTGSLWETGSFASVLAGVLEEKQCTVWNGDDLDGGWE